MTRAEIEAVLQAAFQQCEVAGCALDDRQKQVLRQQLIAALQQVGFSNEPDAESNPLAELTPEQRQALLQFAWDEDQPNRSWKVKLLDDWLHGRSSGSVQFIRELYGVQWLDRIQPAHLAEYADPHQEIRLKVGDQIEVCNGLWEWVQQTGPCGREWFLCTVVSVREVGANLRPVSCTIRFENGNEYEIQGLYEWNRYNWRWPEGGTTLGPENL